MHPKLYFSDVGIYRALRPAGPLDRPEEIGGAALEGIVAQHLRAWIDYSRNGASLSFWRTRSGREVDFVLYGPNVFCALEVKNSAAVRPDDLRSLLAFRDDYPQAELRLLYRGAHRRQISGVLCMPCEELLRELVPGRDLP